MKLNKKGNHVGVILSFVIFIMFVLFLYIFMAPSLESRESRASKINGLQSQILENVTQTMTVRGVKINYPGSVQGKSCFRLINFFLNVPLAERRAIIQTTYTPPLGIYNDSAPKDNDLLLSTGKEKDKLILKNAFVKVYNSSSLPILQLGPDSSGGQCVDVNFSKGEYFVGYTREEKLVMANAIQTLISNYQTNDGYEQLKDKFSFSGDFGFNFTYQDGTNIGTTKYIPQSAEVYSQEYPIVYAANNRGLEVGTLSVRIW